MTLEAHSPLGGFVRRRAPRLRVAQWVHPAPARPVPLPDLASAPKAHRRVEPRRERHGFYGIREWRSGDPASTVHWRASARRNQLVVMDRERPRTPPVVLVGPAIRAVRAGSSRWPARAATAVAACRAGRSGHAHLGAAGPPRPAPPRRPRLVRRARRRTRLAPPATTAPTVALRQAAPGATVLWLATTDLPAAVTTPTRRRRRDRRARARRPTRGATMTIAPYRRETRGWVATAAGLAQVAAARAGMLPWWALPLTIVLTIAVARQTGRSPSSERRSRSLWPFGVGAFSPRSSRSRRSRSVRTDRPAGRPCAADRGPCRALAGDGADLAVPHATTGSGSSVTTGVLIAATVGSTQPDHRRAAGRDLGPRPARPGLDPARRHVGVRRPGRAASRRPPSSSGRLGVTTPVLAVAHRGSTVFLALPAGLGGGGLATHLVHPHGNGAAAPRSPGRSASTPRRRHLSLLVRGALPTTPLCPGARGLTTLWRGSIYPIYTGDSLGGRPTQGFTLAAGNSVSVPPSATDPRPAGTTQTDRRASQPAYDSALLWAPGVPLHIRGVRRQRSVASLRGPANVHIIRAQQDISGYSVTSAVATTSPAG